MPQTSDLSTLRRLIALGLPGQQQGEMLQRLQAMTNRGLAPSAMPTLAAGYSGPQYGAYPEEYAASAPAMSPLAPPAAPPLARPMPSVQRPPQVPTTAAPLRERQAGPAPLPAIPPGATPPMGLGGDPPAPPPTTMGTYQGATPGGIPQQSIEDRARWFAKIGLYPFAGQGYTKERMAQGMVGSPQDTGEAQGLPPARAQAPSPQSLPAMPDRPQVMTPTAASTVLPQERPEEQASPGRAGQGVAKLRALAGIKPPAQPLPNSQLPSQSAVDAMAQAPADPVQGAGFNPQINPEMGGGRAVDQSQADPSYGQNWLQKLLGPNADTLLHAGLGMMSAASKPGATALGALGEGGMFALSEADKRKRLDIQDKREDRQIRQGDRRLDLEDKGLKIKEKDFLLQLEQRATDNKLNREARAAAQAEMLEFRKLQMEATQGNQAAQRSLTAMIEGGRRDDRDSQRQDRLDQGAGTHYERLLGRYKDELGQVTPEARRQAEDVILRAYPTSTFAQQIKTEREAEKAMGEPLPSLNGKPDPTKLTVGKTYSTARGPAKWNGTAFEAAQ